MKPVPAFTSRTWQGAADLPAMIELLGRVRPREWLPDYPSALDLEEMAHLDAFGEKVRLWWVGKQLAGFALLDPVFQNLFFEADPAFKPAVDASRLIRWGIWRWRGIAPADQAETFIDTACRLEDEEKTDWLVKFGFEPQPVWTLRLERDLVQPIPEARLPEGYHIRAAREDDDDAWVEAAQAAHGTENMGLELKSAMRSGIYYEPELDLVVSGPDGAIAGYCVCTINRRENELTGQQVGYTDPIGVRPEYQRRGLARALLAEGMRRLRERGMEVAALGTSGENEVAIRVYEGCGFRVVLRRRWWRKGF